MQKRDRQAAQQEYSELEKSASSPSQKRIGTRSMEII